MTARETRLVVCMALIAVVSFGCESTKIVQPTKSLPDSLTVSGTVWKNTFEVSGAEVYTWPKHGSVYSDSLGHFAFRIRAAGDSADIIATEHGYGVDWFGLSRIAIPPDHRDVSVDVSMWEEPAPAR